MVELSGIALAGLFGVAVVAGCIDAVAGGGGLLTLPTLLACGLPPQAALATNKLQGTAGSLSASLHFVRIKAVDVRGFAWPIACALVGGALGAVVVQRIDAGFLRDVIPWLLIAIAVYMLLARSAGSVERRRRLGLPAFGLTAGLLIGFYDGFFGPGTGTFFALACVGLLGMTLPAATAHTKTLNCASNVASLGLFVAGGQVVWLPGLVMAAGQFIGAQIGARLVVRGGAGLIRAGVVAICIAMAIKLLVWG
jgi:uncharacterized membrane protein YfcA